VKRGRTMKRRFASTAAFVLLALILPEGACNAVRSQEPENSLSALGSIDEYVREEDPLEGSAESALEIRELGIEVRNGTGKLTSGASLPGPIVMRVTADGPAGRAGLRNQRHTTKSVLVDVFIVGALVFPPALFGAVAVADSNFGESHDTIIAVDSERTRDIQELEEAIGRSREGPLLYLTLIRRGRRRQIHVFLHDLNDGTE